MGNTTDSSMGRGGNVLGYSRERSFKDFCMVWLRRPQKADRHVDSDEHKKNELP